MNGFAALLSSMQRKQGYLGSRAEELQLKRNRLREELLEYQWQYLECDARARDIITEYILSCNDYNESVEEYKYITGLELEDLIPTTDGLVKQNARIKIKYLDKVNQLQKSHRKIKNFAEEHTRELEELTADSLRAEKNMFGRVEGTKDKVSRELDSLREKYGTLACLSEENLRMRDDISQTKIKKLGGQSELRSLYSLLAERRAFIHRFESKQAEEEKNLLIQKNKLIEMIDSVENQAEDGIEMVAQRVENQAGIEVDEEEIQAGNEVDGEEIQASIEIVGAMMEKVMSGIGVDNEENQADDERREEIKASLEVFDEEMEPDDEMASPVSEENQQSIGMDYAFIEEIQDIGANTEVNCGGDQ